MTLPADAHVHSEFSWDAGSDPSSVGSMRRTCERAVRIGLPALVFTEHLDLEDHWVAGPEDLGSHAHTLVGVDGRVRLPPLDLDGYLAAIDRCRYDFPELTILTGVEFGQPHLWDAAAADVVRRVDRVNGSLHMLPFEEGDAGAGSGADGAARGAAHDAGARTEPSTLYRYRPPADVMWAYLAEIPRMVAGSVSFAVFTHIDYAVRSWPSATAGPFDPREFEEGFRSGMRAIASSGRALEMNTRRLWSWVPQWWAEEGGRAVTFGSDAHTADALATGFPEATAMLESFGFRAGRRPEEFWTR
ncbi:histidinol-phosphatase (PHP family) [Curtobacterium luteum]|uniref:Histidinol-phosphatase (PHP family) n=1 Tax=Curtobacterium luteum TaxID=33881 RepID=A0A8H9GDF3_9MICO|nr:PHP domain-containing protein [Curtobacterium luteum]MBM7801336.1 histidinol-phosphatase (PHP family) [Curtobacterium luteum]NUU50015.1 hypothetical protein [Curtobacterium luteum]GGL12802.1 hypothetical protein GCM10009769_33440 [Curtobacterium luteum]